MLLNVIKAAFLVLLVRNVSGDDVKSTTEAWVNDPNAKMRKSFSTSNETSLKKHEKSNFSSVIQSLLKKFPVSGTKRLS